MLTYVKESWEELRNNVTWLKREDASNLMVVVAVFSILFALATWGVDEYFSDVITGDLFTLQTYQGYIEQGFLGIMRLVWYLVLTGALLFGISTFLGKNKQ